MKEEDLKKAIGLKNKPDSKRELYSNHVALRVNLEERCGHGRILNIEYLLDEDVVKGLRAMVISPTSRRELMTCRKN